MSRTYKCLKRNVFKRNSYTLLPLRDMDKFKIMKWRNDQLDILRQKRPLQKKEQANYFKQVVSTLFKDPRPGQILWSYLYNDELIGYGGLVHIDWEAGNAEISFLVSTERNKNIIVFKKDWDNYLKLIEQAAFKELQFHKMYTYAYKIRPHYFEVMYKNGYKKEATLKRHVMINGGLKDVLILSKFKGV